MKAHKWLLGSFALILASCAPNQVKEPYTGPERRIFLGSGGVTGVYYPAAGAICRLVNKRQNEHGIICAAESTGGSVYNINTIRQGELDFGVAQSDWQYHAYYGTSKFEDQGPFEGLRAVFSIHPEPMNVVARTDSGIKTFGDLKGKRVNIGNPGSGQRGMMEVVSREFGWTKSDFSIATEAKSSQQGELLCDNRVDAIVYTVGHPSGSIKWITENCDTRLVTIAGPEIDRLVEENSYYRHAVIPRGMYRGNNRSTKTFGVGATFVTSVDTPPDVVYWVVKSVFEDFSAFKRLHPAFANLKKKEMIKDSLTAPLHEGAARYYKEAGLM